MNGNRTVPLTTAVNPKMFKIILFLFKVGLLLFYNLENKVLRKARKLPAF